MSEWKKEAPIEKGLRAGAHAGDFKGMWLKIEEPELPEL